MWRTSATITLIPELEGGPFLFSGDLVDACRQAAAAGFDAVELVIPDADSVNPKLLGETLATYRLKLAAVSSGGGFLIHRLHLTCPETDKRRQALAYVSDVIDLAGPFGAAVIIGVMKGYLGKGTDRPAAVARAGEALEALARRAARHNTGLVIEPLNRYESNFINTLGEAVELIEPLGADNVKLLADLFHMNIEERSITQALREAGRHIGHVHLADSNRLPPGRGHTDFVEVGRALRDIGYEGYLSAEVLPAPDAQAAARQFLSVIREHLAPP